MYGSPLKRLLFLLLAWNYCISIFCCNKKHCCMQIHIQ